jgi:ferric-dicitrate binding protein FerR (iron transport regulator)
MERSHLDDLWSRWSTEGLPPPEERELALAIATDKALRDEILRDQHIEGALLAFGRGAHDADAFVGRFVQRLAAEDDGPRFAAAVERRVRVELAPPVRRRRRSLLAWMGVLIPVAALAIVLVARKQPGPDPLTVASGQRRQPEPMSATESGHGVRPTADLPVARVERLTGAAVMLADGRKTPLHPGDPVAMGQGVMTTGADSRATIAFPDRTSIQLVGDTLLDHISEAHGKMAFLSRGRLRAEVSPQAAGSPLVLSTPHAEVTVVGTRFTLAVADSSTRLDVEEGRVKVAPDSGGQPTLVSAGQSMVSVAGASAPALSGGRGTALLVTPRATLDLADRRIQARLQSLGFEVVIDPSAEPRIADGRKPVVVVISSTVNSYEVSTVYRDLKIPIVTWESWLYPDLGMTAPLAHLAGQAGVVAPGGELVVETSDHPLAAGLNGQVQVLAGVPPKSDINTERRLQMAFGLPGPAATVIATAPGARARPVVFAYERGAPMPGLAAAPARRVGFFLWDDNSPLLTDAGWKLFDAAVLWSVGLSD